MALNVLSATFRPFFDISVYKANMVIGLKVALNAYFVPIGIISAGDEKTHMNPSKFNAYFPFTIISPVSIYIQE